MPCTWARSYEILTHRPGCTLRCAAVKHYDTDNDFMITVDEFSAGLTNLPKCCGAACPFRSLCGALELQVFPTSSASGDNTLSGRSGIVTDSEFLARIKALNDTTLVPNCLTEGVIQEPTAASRVGLKIIADEARVETTTEAWATPSRPDNLQEGSTLNTTFWSPEGRVDGMKLLKRDADRLTAEVRTPATLPPGCGTSLAHRRRAHPHNRRTLVDAGARCVRPY